MLEFPTPAVYHACNTHPGKLDKVQSRFLSEVGLTAEDAFLKFNLAPLQTRRDIAGLGIVHRTVLGLGPPQFRKWFFLLVKLRTLTTLVYRPVVTTNSCTTIWMDRTTC